MFQNIDNDIKDAKLIDYQLVTYNSFSLDLLAFIFLNASIEVQTKHLDTVLKHYYEIFISITGEGDKFTWKILKNEFEKNLLFGLCLILIFWPIFSSRDTSEMDLADILNGKFNPWTKEKYKNPEFIKMFKNIVPYFVEKLS